MPHLTNSLKTEIFRHVASPQEKNELTTFKKANSSTIFHTRNRKVFSSHLNMERLTLSTLYVFRKKRAHNKCIFLKSGVNFGFINCHTIKQTLGEVPKEDLNLLIPTDIETLLSFIIFFPSM